MKKMHGVKWSKAGIAAGLAAILLLGITTVAAPSANKDRVEREYMTELSADNWTARSVYNSGERVESFRLNGREVTGTFPFEKDDVLVVEVPQTLTGSYKIGLRYLVFAGISGCNLYGISSLYLEG